MNGKKYIFINVDETPIEYAMCEDKVYVCNNDATASLKCPCGCGDNIIINLLQTTSPKWTVNGNTITPSINRTVNCRSHFSIKNGEVEKH